jgi:hypothetical protein
MSPAAELHPSRRNDGEPTAPHHLVTSFRFFAASENIIIIRQRGIGSHAAKSAIMESYPAACDNRLGLRLVLRQHVHAAGDAAALGDVRRRLSRLLLNGGPF